MGYDSLEVRNAVPKSEKLKCLYTHEITAQHSRVAAICKSWAKMIREQIYPYVRDLREPKTTVSRQAHQELG